MGDVDAERLRAVAEAATPGEWGQRADTPWGSKVIVNTSGEMFLGVSAQTAMPTDGWSSSARARATELGKSKCADARHIATFDPPTVLALLDRLTAAEATVARVVVLADEVERQVAAHEHHNPSVAGALESVGAELRAALGGDGGGMGPVASMEGPRSDERGQGRVSGHLGERQDGSGER